MLESVINLFGGWQVKLAILFIAFVSLFAYHKYEVHKAVNKATTELQLQHSKELIRQVEIARNESIKLRQDKEKSDAEYKKNISVANAKYKSLSDWVSNLPNISRSDNPGNSTSEQIRSEDVVGELRRKHAEDLAGYSLRAETLRQDLLGCYRDYDSVKERLDNLRLQDSSKKP